MYWLGRWQSVISSFVNKTDEERVKPVAPQNRIKSQIRIHCYVIRARPISEHSHDMEIRIITDLAAIRCKQRIICFTVFTDGPSCQLLSTLGANLVWQSTHLGVTSHVPTVAINGMKKMDIKRNADT